MRSCLISYAWAHTSITSSGNSRNVQRHLSVVEEEEGERPLNPFLTPEPECSFEPLSTLFCFSTLFGRFAEGAFEGARRAQERF